MWIFGYGSLVWKVDFPYVRKVIGYIKGYERKFWQASIDHRGVPEKPGRVVTLVPSTDPEASVWGVAFEIDDNDTNTIESINHRERRFTQIRITFYPSITQTNAHLCNKEFQNYAIDLNTYEVNVYTSTKYNPLFLGDTSIHEMAMQIATAKGPSGHNFEYVFKLAHFMRTYLPNVVDSHLFEIENELLLALKSLATPPSI